MSHLRYIDQFLSFRCAADVIKVAHPVNKFTKEISEAMSVIRRIKPKLLKRPMDYTVIDLCSGNALVPLISAFMLPSKWNYAIDKRPRSRPWHEVRRFTYLHHDIYDKSISKSIDQIDGPVILTAVHACQGLAERIAKLYSTTKAEMLVMMPCCVGKIPQKLSDKLAGQIGRDRLWGLHLSSLVSGRLVQDDDIISPKRLSVIADQSGTSEEEEQVAT
jgi:hypothetical protein